MYFGTSKAPHSFLHGVTTTIRVSYRGDGGMGGGGGGGGGGAGIPPPPPPPSRNPEIEYGYCCFVTGIKPQILSQIASEAI